MPAALESKPARGRGLRQKLCVHAIGAFPLTSCITEKVTLGATEEPFMLGGAAHATAGAPGPSEPSLAVAPATAQAASVPGDAGKEIEASTRPEAPGARLAAVGGLAVTMGVVLVTAGAMRAGHTPVVRQRPGGFKKQATPTGGSTRAYQDRAMRGLGLLRYFLVHVDHQARRSLHPACW